MSFVQTDRLQSRGWRGVRGVRRESSSGTAGAVLDAWTCCSSSVHAAFAASDFCLDGKGWC